MNEYWLSRASQVEAELDQLQREYHDAIKQYQTRIEELERKLLEANCNAQTTGTTNESVQ